MRIHEASLAALVTSLVLLTSAPAHAFVCSRTETNDFAELSSGPALSWFTRNLDFTLHGGGTDTIPGQLEFDELRAAFVPWSEAQSCNSGLETDVSFRWTGVLSDTDVIGFNFLNDAVNENLLIFRDGVWPEPGQGALIIALTTTTFSANTGQILDADIEFNSANVDFLIVGNVGDTGSQDLLNTTVHEVGHFIGLAHTRVVGATMLAQASPGETIKRDLACDDHEAVVFKYPQDQPNGYCDADDVVETCGFCEPPTEADVIVEPEVTGFSRSGGGGGCATGAGFDLLGFALVLRRRRRL